MGVKRQTIWPDLICNVVLVGDAKVGKTSLITKATSEKFSEGYGKTSFHGGSGEKTEWNATVAGRKVKFLIVDMCGGVRGGFSANGTQGANGNQGNNYQRSTSSLSLTSCTGSTYFETSQARKSSLVYQKADIFLLCYKISDPSSLFSALNHWCPEIRSQCPSTPIILVGCQSDMRCDRDVLATLARRGLAPVSAEQGLSLSQQAGCLMYVETSAKGGGRSAHSAFELAALALLGQISTRPFPNHVEATRAYSVSTNQLQESMKSFSMSANHLADTPRPVLPPPVPPKPMVQPESPVNTISTPVVPPKPATRKALSTLALNSSAELSLYRDTSNEFELETYSPEPRQRFPVRPSRAGNIVPQNFRQSCIDLNATNMSTTSSSTASSASSCGVVVSKRNQKYISASRGHLSVTTSPSSPRLNFKTSRDRDRSVSSLLSIGTNHRTPKVARRGIQNEEKTVTIKCQRLTADKKYEEVDVEVPAPIYETLRLYNHNNEDGGSSNTGSVGSKPETQTVSSQKATTEDGATGKSRSIAERIKNLFGSNTRN